MSLRQLRRPLRDRDMIPAIEELEAIGNRGGSRSSKSGVRVVLLLAAMTLTWVGCSTDTTRWGPSVYPLRCSSTVLMRPQERRGIRKSPATHGCRTLSFAAKKTPRNS
jgi:hypothetical protein